MSITTVIGGFFGDEGKGKQIAAEAQQLSKSKKSFRTDFSGKPIVGYGVRSNGGPNGGHALVENKVKVSGHVVPSTILYQNILSVIGAGCAINFEKLDDEISDFKKAGFFRGDLALDGNAQVITPPYCVLDGMRNNRNSTCSGISDVYGHKGKRDGIRARDLLDERRLVEKLKVLVPSLHSEMYGLISQNLDLPLGHERVAQDERFKRFVNEFSLDKVVNNLLSQRGLAEKIVSNRVADELRDAVYMDRPILNEGSQSYFLGIDSGFELGSSSIISPSGIFITQGIPQTNQRIIVVVKAFFSRVGNGFFVGEYGDRSIALKKDELLESLGFSINSKREEYLPKAIEMMRSSDPQVIGDGLRLYYGEYGETTKFPRGKAPFDIVAMRTLYEHIARNSSSEVELHINQMDGLEHFEKLPFTTRYRSPSGELFTTITMENDAQLRELTPITEYLPSWDKPLRGEYSGWNQRAKDWVKFVEDNTGFKVKGVGNGPEATDMMYLP